mmetsp:Transcript_72359/g.233893  ORF Transcript_72359/g.233893 Transcript_72359/m.233893 type:complete len:215 (-) Transcript_72359:900-1544(-)
MLLVLHAYSNNVCSVSTSQALMSVVSKRRSSMFMSTVPFLVTICFRLKVLSLSLGGSNAAFRSAKGSRTDCCTCGDFVGLPPFSLLVDEDRCGDDMSGNSLAREGEPEAEAASSAPLWARPWRDTGGVEEASAPAPNMDGSCSMWLNSGKFAVTGFCTPSFPFSMGKSMIFESAPSILRSVTLSNTWNEISSGPVLETCGCPVSCKKRHKARMT